MNGGALDSAGQLFDRCGDHDLADSHWGLLRGHVKRLEMKADELVQ